MLTIILLLLIDLNHSLVAPCDRPWVSRMLDSCLFFCPDTICETSQVLKVSGGDNIGVAEALYKLFHRELRLERHITVLVRHCLLCIVAQFCANDKEIMGYLRTRIVLDVDGYYMGAIFAVQPIPVVMEGKDCIIS